MGENEILGSVDVTQTRFGNYVFHRKRLLLVDSVVFYLLSPARMQGAGGRRFYARLLSYSGWHNRYSFLAVQRHTTDQKTWIMVLGFLASGNYFRDCPTRRNCFYRALDLSPCISSLRAGNPSRNSPLRFPSSAKEGQDALAWLNSPKVRGLNRHEIFVFDATPCEVAAPKLRLYRDRSALLGSAI